MSFEEYFTVEKCISAVLFVFVLFFQEFIKEMAHGIKVWLGMKSNITLALYRDKKIDEEIKRLVDGNDCVGSAVIGKITNGGGVPKEGAPLNSYIVNPIEKRSDWTFSEVTPFFRGTFQRVYSEKRLLLSVEDIPVGDPTYSYLKSQKEKIECVKLILLKEKRKCRYILSIRLTCQPEEFFPDNRLRENIRYAASNIRKYIS